MAFPPLFRFFGGLIIGATLAQTTLSAALPPFYESIREIEAIFADKNLADKLQTPYPIDSIERVDGGWRIAAGGKVVKAKVIALANSRPGPMRFRIEWE